MTRCCTSGSFRAWRGSSLEYRTGMPAERSPDDALRFRSALGAFATGVTIVTTRDAEGRDVGLTANSFNSVSLDPPMVLWSLAKNARSLPAFLAATHFAVHVLAADQDGLSQRFSARGSDKFAGLDLERGPAQVPLLRGCSARFQCRTAFRHEGGDHVIFVGAVESFDQSDRPPLIFHGGRYALAIRKEPQPRARAGKRRARQQLQSGLPGLPARPRSISTLHLAAARPGAAWADRRPVVRAQHPRRIRRPQRGGARSPALATPATASRPSCSPASRRRDSSNCVATIRTSGSL